MRYIVHNVYKKAVRKVVLIMKYKRRITKSGDCSVQFWCKGYMVASCCIQINAHHIHKVLVRELRNTHRRS